MICRLAHLCFVTDQLDVMKHFYHQTLGLPLKIRFQNKDGQTFGYYFDCGDSSFIEIFDRTLMHKQWGTGELTPRVAGNQYRHFCFETTGLADLRTKLIAQGLPVTELRRGMDRSWQAWIKDPDGNDIEMMEYTAESLQIRNTNPTEPSLAT